MFETKDRSSHLAWSEKTIKEYDFAEILKRSICLEQSTQAWCENVEVSATVSANTQHSLLPDVLVINCEWNSAKEAEFWKVQAEYAFNKAMQKEAMELQNPRSLPMPTEWLWMARSCATWSAYFDTVQRDLRHVWIPLTLKMSSAKSGLEISSWPEGEELSAAEEADGASLYDLVVTVPHVLDARTVKNPIDASVLLTEASLARKQRKSHATFPLMVSEMHRRRPGGTGR
ncbi:hypothetical protein INR49_003556 [Caranx melampygus]|nr:hypothetical protein INR49_003556 [Caranx melampygus]